MYNYLYSHGLNSREYKIITGNIRQMLSDAEAWGECAERLLPDGYRVFCGEIQKNAVRKNWPEMLLEGMFWRWQLRL